MKKGDIVLIIILVFLLMLWVIPSSEGSSVFIYVDGKLYKKIPLDTDTQVNLESQWGKNTVVIKNGEVFITDADCPDKLCEKHKIDKSGRSIICLPNRVSVTVEGEKSEEKIDVII